MSGLEFVQEIDGEYRGPRSVLFFGVRQPSYVPFDPNFESDLPRFLTRPDDVWIASFPKSGTTWLSEIVWQIYNNGSTSDTKLNKRVPFLEGNKLLSKNQTDSRPSLESRLSPRMIHSHLPYHVIPMDKGEGAKCKYIYIARNPKDVAVSYFHFLQSFGEDACGFRGPFEFLANIFLKGKVDYGLWHEHVLEWWKHKDSPNILFLKYEDLKKDLEAEVRKIAQFLEKSLPDETIKRITKQCTFKEMSKNISNYWVLNKDGPRLLRKGEIGDWKHFFTPELNEAFDVKILSNLDGTGLNFDSEPSQLPSL